MVVAGVGWGEVELLVWEAVCVGGSQAWSGLFCFVLFLSEINQALVYARPLERGSEWNDLAGHAQG